MKTFKKAFYFPLLFLFLLFNLFNTVNAANIAFASVKIDSNSSVDAVTINGALITIGNQVLCKSTADFAACQDPGTTGNTQNNYHTQYRTRIDSNVTHSNSMAKLVLQPGDSIIFARLYWSARADSTTDAESAAARNVRIKGPASTAYTLFVSPTSKHGSSSVDYGASADVTQYVQNNGAGDYYVGDILSDTGATGIYASWQLVVVVENAARSLKNIAIYDGFDSIYGTSTNPDTITVGATGFITPTGTDPFNASLFVYAGETDDGYGDSSEIQDGSGTWHNLVDGQNDPNDVMNASVSSPDYPTGYRDGNASLANPNYRNVLGVDIDKLQINDKLNTSQQFLSNSQTSTQIRLTSTGDRYSLNMFAFETEVFVPEFCYDYAYKQQGKYFTEDNGGTQDPRLTGDVIEGEPIEMTIFLKSMVDGTIQIQNMTIDVDDINTTQVTYIPNVSPNPVPDTNTKVAKVGELYAQDVSVTAGTASGMDYIHDIPIGILDQNEYFYLYYSLDPQTDTLDMPIHVTANYQLALGTVTVPYSLILSQDIPLCSTSNFEYTPATGIFNIAHNNYYTYDQSSGGNKYYNLPTQVTKREGNFKVLAMDPDDHNELAFDHVSTVVAVEMIDAGAFHFTEASCKEMASSISDRIWVRLDENVTSVPFTQAAIQAAITNGLTDLNNSADYYSIATQNTAFRITYNSTDLNGSVVELETIGDRSNVANFASLAGMDCVQDVDGNPTNTDTVAQFCSNAGSPYASAMTDAQLKTCMECVYGIDTRFICSRDNFALRPEAFMLKLNDQVQHQLIPTDTRVRFADDRSGVDTSTGTLSTSQVDLAAGYQYKLEVNATNHLSNTSSLGYTRTFGVGSEDVIEYRWIPGTLGVCNDESNSTIEFKIVDGKIDLNTSLNQVGGYILHMHDETWTSVDSNPSFMTHHNGLPTYFIPPTTALDCTSGSATYVVNSATDNGCDINSTHSASATSLEYRDYNVEFHPYWFDLNNTITPTVGVNHLDVNATSFIYMADMNFSNGQDENMSYHLNGNIVPLGENNATLSNFVDNCYAKPLRIDLNVTSPSGTLINFPVAYQYRFHSLDENGTDLRATITTQNLNNGGTTTSLSVLTSDFPKHLNGAASTLFNLNYDRNASTPLNPEAISFDRYDVNCTNPTTDCTFFADTDGTTVETTTSKGTKDLNSSISIKHYYGRTHAPRNRFVGPDGNVTVYYEVFCNGTVNGTTCNKQLLQTELTTNLNSKVTDDPRWFINNEHDVNNHGPVIAPATPLVTPVGVIAQKGGANRVTNTPNVVYNTIPTGPTLIPLQYDVTRGYPYKATMLNTPNRWLIYNKYDATATANESEVEFVSGNSNWAGKRETTNTTSEVGSKKTNRRSMW